MTYRGKVQNGMVVVEGPMPPEGASLRMEVEEEKAAEESRVWQDLLELAGSCPDMPKDMAENHDHYLYGVTKREKQG